MRETTVDGGRIVQYGHWGRPVLAFPAEGGSAYDFAERGMVDAVGGLIADGRIKLYCVDSDDGASWSATDLPLEERARRYAGYEAWIVEHVLPIVHAETGGDVIAVGVSLGAFHALNLALKHADAFPLAICLSGNYDPTSWHGWGERGDAVYFNNPVDYVPNLHGDHLDWLRSRLSVLLVCGQGRWEDTTGALASTRHMAGLLGDKGIAVELDLWGHDVPHDWPSWRAQLAHHLPRFC
jgi:esterase/lipase superfamily enzyme